MKNYIKPFNQFINESEDWFEHTADRVPWRYTIHGRWRQKGQTDYDNMGEPDEEIETEEFLDRHKGKIAPHNAEWMRSLGPGKVRVWKHKPEPATPSRIQSMSDDELLDVYDKVREKISKMPADMAVSKWVHKTFQEMKDEITSRGL